VSDTGSALRVRGPLAVAGVTLGLLTWPIAFNLGAYGQVLYDDVFRVMVAATILFVVTLINPAYPGPWRWLVSIALAAPLAWFLAASIMVGSTSEALDRPVFVLALGLILLFSLPITLRLLVDLFTPELTSERSRRLTLSIVALVAVVGILGFAFGRNNHRYMTCGDFAIAGAAEPDNCQP
jgi:hypothetical protein